MIVEEDQQVREIREHIEGLGSIYRPVYVDRKSGRRRVAATWYIEYGHRGDRHREATHSKKRGDAVALLKRRAAERQTGNIVGPVVEKTTFEQLKDLLLTDFKVNGKRSLERMETAIAHLEEHFTGRLALDITADRIGRYVLDRQREKAANATINRSWRH